MHRLEVALVSDLGQRGVWAEILPKEAGSETREIRDQEMRARGFSSGAPLALEMELYQRLALRAQSEAGQGVQACQLAAHSQR